MSDSTNTAAIAIDLTPVPVTVTRRPCMCGCGGFPANPNARFIPGHDAKLKSALIAAHLANVASLTITDENGVREVTPLEFATELNWDPFLITAKRKQERELADKAAKANKVS